MRTREPVHSCSSVNLDLACHPLSLLNAGCSMVDPLGLPATPPCDLERSDSPNCRGPGVSEEDLPTSAPQDFPEASHVVEEIIVCACLQSGVKVNREAQNEPRLMFPETWPGGGG